MRSSWNSAALFLLVSWALACQQSASFADSAQRPNIIFILADDMGYGDLGCQNPDSKIPTPHLDALATQGMRFSDAHSPSAVCTPTRYSILTGDYCWRTRLQASVLWTWDGPLIDAEKLTLGGMLQQQGYSTACIGKWHLGWEWPTKDGGSINNALSRGEWNVEARNAFGARVDFTRPIKGGPVTRGFDYYFGDDVPNFAPYCFLENDRSVGLPSAEKPKDMFGTEGPMLPGWKLDQVMPTITQKAVDYIRSTSESNRFGRRQGAPFFLYFPLTAPHSPIAPTEAFMGKSGAHRYGDFVAEVDWTVGQVMQALRESGQEENTILIFSSDNGSPGRSGENMQGPINSVREFGHNPSHIFRGIKADIWEGGHRVPCIVRWPTTVRAGAVSDETICLVDMLATMAEVTSFEVPKDTAVDSVSLLPLLRESGARAPEREAIVHHSIDGTFAMRRGKWKLIFGRGSGGWSGKGDPNDPPGQLYDLERDPEEQVNRYNDAPEIVAELSALLERYRVEGRSAGLAK